MANLDAAGGFIPRRYVSGQSYTGAVERVHVASADSSVFRLGDLVKLTGAADAEGIPTVTRPTAGDAVVGAVVGFEITPGIIAAGYLAGSIGGYLHVATDPDVLFEVQEDADGGALAVASVGLNANYVVGSGSGRLSTDELDTSTAATTNTLPLRIVAFQRRADNEAASANAKVLVKINVHQRVSTTGA